MLKLQIKIIIENKITYKKRVVVNPTINPGYQGCSHNKTELAASTSSRHDSNFLFKFFICFSYKITQKVGKNDTNKTLK